jgi:hypothetical protein
VAAVLQSGCWEIVRFNFTVTVFLTSLSIPPSWSNMAFSLPVMSSS